MNFIKQLATFCVLAVIFSPIANATIITFDGETPVFVIPEDYGSRINASSPSFLEGNGFTQNIEVSYSRDLVGQENFSVWSNYSTLVNALGHNNFNVPGEIIFTADPGYNVVLNSFVMAAWTGQYDSRIVILDGASTALFDTGNFLLDGTDGPQNYTFPMALQSSIIRIRFEDYGDLAIDDINFDQVAVSSVSAPQTLAIFAFGALILSVKRAKKKLF